MDKLLIKTLQEGMDKRGILIDKECMKILVELSLFKSKDVSQEIYIKLYKEHFSVIYSKLFYSYSELWLSIIKYGEGEIKESSIKHSRECINTTYNNIEKNLKELLKVVQESSTLPSDEYTSKLSDIKVGLALNIHTLQMVCIPLIENLASIAKFNNGLH